MTDDQNEAQAQRVSEAVYKATYAATRQAVKDEALLYTSEIVGPAVEAILELQKSVGMLIDGQALIERHLAGTLGDDDSNEDWRQSLGDD